MSLVLCGAEALSCIWNISESSSRGGVSRARFLFHLRHQKKPATPKRAKTTTMAATLIPALKPTLCVIDTGAEDAVLCADPAVMLWLVVLEVAWVED